MSRTFYGLIVVSLVLLSGCARKKAMEDCLAKNLDQCEVVCLDSATPQSDIGLTCSAASSKYMKQNPPDLKHAEMLLDRACNAGASEVCVTMANRYLKGGNGISRDRVKARTYFKKACDANYQPGCKGEETLDQIDDFFKLRDAGGDAAALGLPALTPHDE